MGKRKNINKSLRNQLKAQLTSNSSSTSKASIKSIKKSVKKELDPEDIPSFEWSYDIGELVMSKRYNTIHMIVEVVDIRKSRIMKKAGSKAYMLIPAAGENPVLGRLIKYL